MSYIKIDTKEILEVGDVLKMFPNVSLPNMAWTDEMLAPLGIAELHYPVEHPFPSHYEYLLEGEPVFQDDKWYKTFTVESTIPTDDSFEYWLNLEKAKLKEKNAQRRYEREISGVTVNDMNIKTDRESQSLVTGAYISLKEGFIQSVEWKSSDNGWITLGLSEIESIAKAIAEHVENCFNDEKQQNVLIDAISTKQQLLDYLG